MSSARVRFKDEVTSIDSESIVGWERCESRSARASSGGRRVRNSGIGRVQVQVSGIRLANPKRDGEKVGGQSKDGEGGGMEESPVGRQSKGYVAELKNLIENEGKGEEGRPDE